MTHTISRRPHAAGAGGLGHDRLDMAALRRALHGWWFGNPLVEVAPGKACAVYARELAVAGAAAGTAIIQLTHTADAGSPAAPAPRSTASAAVLTLTLLLPAALPGEKLLHEAGETLAEVARARFGLDASVAGPPAVQLGGAGHACQLALEDAAPDQRLLTITLTCAGLAAPHDGAALRALVTPSASASSREVDRRSFEPELRMGEELLAAWLRRLNLRYVALEVELGEHGATATSD